MNLIRKNPIQALGYQFISDMDIPGGKDEYYLRNRQNRNGIPYRSLSAYEIEVLVRNRNTSDNWNNILVSDAFNPEQVHDCKFYGLVRIGKLEPHYVEFKNLRRPVGLYNSTIISCDFGDNVVIDNVNYIAHYIIGDDVIIVNVNELATTNYAKFGNGVVKDGEEEQSRIWLELCNENGGRKVIPFEGMLPGDAWLWTRDRDDKALQDQFHSFTLQRFDTHRGYYGMIGDRTVIKNCKIIKDVNIGTDAYLKGANKLKNLTINSTADAKSQIGEGCELVNGIIEPGCRIFYGVKAVRFYMASHSQLKYGARLINSYLGNNSTISCCEVLNSLIFPFHEQHHNNSFLCAATLAGQTNIAAGATIGSNHNSRGPDGELVAGRGFWPGLCVSLKHNSRFASFTILAKGDYPAELDIPLPFSLVSNDITHDRLTIMPGYWFMYNMYALARNAWKYTVRDMRTEKFQQIEMHYLAPDTVQEMIDALEIFERCCGEAWKRTHPGETSDAQALGRRLLLRRDPALEKLEITANEFEHAKRPVLLLKVPACYHLFRDLIAHYAVTQLLEFTAGEAPGSLRKLQASLPARPVLHRWVNVGGQLIRASALDGLQEQIRRKKLKSWEEVHAFYRAQGEAYAREKLVHALAAYRKTFGKPLVTADGGSLKAALRDSAATYERIVHQIYLSRKKDYTNPFRRMVYSSQKEMDIVVGGLEENPFILQERENLRNYKRRINGLIRRLGI